MVTGVSGSVSASALIRERPSQSAAPRDDISPAARDIDSFRKASEPSRETDTRKDVLEPEKTTQLEVRNDDKTLKTEETRGSLLDLAV